MMRIKYVKVKIAFVIICSMICCWTITLSAFDLEIQYFTVQGLRLNMNLDQVISTFNISNIKAIKDKNGDISEYEIKKNVGNKLLTLRFTGEKRLYRIQYINTYRSFINRSGEILDQLIVKYGEPNWKYHPIKNNQPLDIFACWGVLCSRETYAPLEPKLTANIYYRTGKVKLVLANHAIFNEDWEIYKQRRKGRLNKQLNNTANQQENLDF
jgi:hypothetical protein